MRRCLTFVAVLAAFGCTKPGTEEPAKTTKIATTYRVITGISMGAIGASALGLSSSEKVDGVASMGGPIDAAFFAHTLDERFSGGFCPRAALEAQLAKDPAGLNDPALMNACKQAQAPLMQFEHPNEFNHFFTTISGSNFNRDQYVRLMTDLMLAYGNFFTENPASAFAPPGVDPERLRLQKIPADFCTAPVRVKGLRNAEYNPDGRYDAITFCDGEPTLFFCNDTREVVDFCSDARNVATPLPVSKEVAFASTYCQSKGGTSQATAQSEALFVLDHSGYRDPCREAVVPQGALLAFDYNGNGRRDYGEPIVNNGHERFDDVGVDGCADAFENGSGGCSSTSNPAAIDPNRDNYEVDGNPTGTEADWVWEPGEPFRDDGLDGVPGSKDLGEGNGAFDMSGGRKSLFAYDGRTNFRNLTPEGRARIAVYGDGGIRDVFNFGLMAKHLIAGVKAFRTTAVGYYRDFTEVPGLYDARRMLFNPWSRAWARIPRDLLLFYGIDPPTDKMRVDGEGDHVGTAQEALNRVSMTLNWAAQTWPSLPRPPTNGPSASTKSRQRIEWFDSTKLKAKWEFVVSLPPGYDDPANAGVRYPVVYLLHGYGMEPADLLSTALLTDAYASDPDIQFRPMIVVLPDGKCCWFNTDGRRDCREHDDAGDAFNGGPGWARECNSGTFWINRKGYTSSDSTAYGDAMFELFDHVDSTFRTLRPAEVEAR